VEPVVKAIRAAAAEAGRNIDEDHFGASFAFRLASSSEPAATVGAAGRVPSDFVVVGDLSDVIRRCSEYHRAGISKFVLIPLGNDDADLMAQTRRVVDEVIPVVHDW
jgi:alkanesulfonate monooxygenase SsuD/methylene tetrahydromethanopterin reductase-like flavin-dependent oxidoreductase (luciferase family)